MMYTHEYNDWINNNTEVQINQYSHRYKILLQLTVDA